MRIIQDLFTGLRWLLIESLSALYLPLQIAACLVLGLSFPSWSEHRRQVRSIFKLD